MTLIGIPLTNHNVAFWKCSNVNADSTVVCVLRGPSGLEVFGKMTWYDLIRNDMTLECLFGCNSRYDQTVSWSLYFINNSRLGSRRSRRSQMHIYAICVHSWMNQNNLVWPGKYQFWKIIKMRNSHLWSEWHIYYLPCDFPAIYLGCPL